MAILLTAHDPEWRRQAAFLIRDLIALFGPLAERIDHVGSTAIPGIVAKPKLHLDVSLAGDTFPETAKARLDGLDYTDHGHRFRSDEVQLTRPTGPWFAIYYDSRPQAAMAHRLSLCSPGCPAAIERRRFRDALRQDAELARAYEELKCQLATNSIGTKGWDDYAQGKSAFIAAVLAGRQWTPAEGRTPEPKTGQNG